MDNQRIRGIESDASRGKHKPKGKQKKSYLIEWRMIPPPNRKSVVYQFPRFGSWSIWGRYLTAVRRDQAYASLVRKEENMRLGPLWGRSLFRKIDPDEET